ncbi:MAG: peptidoglycan-binding protein [Gammaproteobacteria bacterium]|nr:peptidoglycan-binding protein [Gammaproteobacteria bacterium]
MITGGTYNDYLSQRVRRFQRDQGLDVDGILGRMTLLRLNTLSRDVPTLAGAVE